MKNIRRYLTLSAALLAISLLTGCTLSPHASVGLDVNYYGGKFHVDPNIHVGITGYP